MSYTLVNARSVTIEKLILTRYSSVVILIDRSSFGGVIKFCWDECKEQEVMK